MAETFKNIIKKTEDTEIEVKKIWNLAYQMTEDKFVEKLFTKPEADKTLSELDNWENFKEEVRQSKKKMNDSAIAWEKVNLVETEMIKDSKEFIDIFYDMLMSISLKAKSKSSDEERIAFLKNRIKEIQTISTWLYNEMCKKEIIRTAKAKHKQPTITMENELKQIKNVQEEVSPKLSAAKEQIFLSKEERDQLASDYQEKINKHKQKILEREHEIFTTADWEELVGFAKLTDREYNWLATYRNTHDGTLMEIPNNYLSTLNQCIATFYKKYEKEIPENDLPEIVHHIESILISSDINEQKEIIEKLSKEKNVPEILKIKDFLGNEYEIGKMYLPVFQSLENKQKETIIDYQKAIEFLNSPVEKDTPKL